MSIQSQAIAETAKDSIAEVNKLTLINDAKTSLLHVSPQSIESLRVLDPKAETDEKPRKPQLIVFDGFQIYVTELSAKTESVQAGMQKPRQIHNVTLKLTTDAQDESATDFITPQISVTDAEGKIDVTYTHVFTYNTATSRTYQYNLSRKPEDATVSIIFKDADGETLTHPCKMTYSNRSPKRITSPRSL